MTDRHAKIGTGQGSRPEGLGSASVGPAPATCECEWGDRDPLTCVEAGRCLGEARDAALCPYCGHAWSCHGDQGCEVEVRDYGEMDCTCPRGPTGLLVGRYPRSGDATAALHD